jgi:hypothetical protein
MRENPHLEVTPWTFCFAGKAAPAYQLAKLIIELVNNLAGTIDGDPSMRGRLTVVLLPKYDVSLAERLIPASDVSIAEYTAEITGRTGRDPGEHYRELMAAFGTPYYTRIDAGRRTDHGQEEGVLPAPGTSFCSSRPREHNCPNMQDRFATDVSL